MRRIAQLLVVFAACSCAALERGDATGDDATANDASVVAVIPFTLSAHNNILVSAELNGADRVQLMFHTAARGLFLTEAARAKTPSVRWGASGTSASWGGRGETRSSSGNALRIGELRWSGLDLIQDKLSGQGSDGKFGPDLFGDKVVELDFAARCIRLHRALPDECARFASLPIRTRLGSPFVELGVEVGGELHRHDFMLHTGYSGSLLFDTDFARRAHVLRELPLERTSELRDAMGNVLVTRHVTVPRVVFGENALAQVSAAVFDGSLRSQKFSVLGAALLRRFRCFLDLQKGARLYLAPLDES